MYDDPADRYILGMDRRVMDWLVEFIRLFAANKEQYDTIADQIAGSKNYGDKKRLALQGGMFKLDDILTYITHTVLEKQSFSSAFRFKGALLGRLYEHELSVDMTAMPPMNGIDVWLSEKIIPLYVELDCLDNAIFGIHYVLDKYRSSICHISVQDDSGHHYGGSGFIVRLETGPCVITNRHVVDPNRWQIRSIQTTDGELPFGSVKASDEHDLATVEIPHDTTQRPLQLYRGGRVLERIVTIGYPFVPRVAGPELMVHAGEVNGFTETWDREKLMFISAAVAPGSSGGPVINKLGLVVGVTTQNLEADYSTGSRGDDTDIIRSIYHAAVPAQYVMEFLGL